VWLQQQEDRSPDFLGLLPSLLLAQGWVWVMLPQEQACLELKQWLGAAGRVLGLGATERAGQLVRRVWLQQQEDRSPDFLDLLLSLLPSLLLAQGWVWVVLPQEQQAYLGLKQWLGAAGLMLRQGWQQFQQQG
jgi:hypothetical protein